MGMICWEDLFVLTGLCDVNEGSYVMPYETLSSDWSRATRSTKGWYWLKYPHLITVIVVIIGILFDTLILHKQIPGN